MKVSVIEHTQAILRFKVDGITESFANAMRRVGLSRVRCFAVGSVTFYENSSAIFDEYIAHRLGLVPITSPKRRSDTEVLLSLEAEGPSTVYSKSLKSNEDDIKVANENIPIIKLAEGQRLKVEAKCIMGSGSESSKFQPGIFTYRPLDNEKGFEFYVESFGQMSAADIVNRMLSIMSEGVKEAIKELS